MNDIKTIYINIRNLMTNRQENSGTKDKVNARICNCYNGKVIRNFNNNKMLIKVKNNKK